MSPPQNSDVLKNELDDVIYVHLCNYITTCPVQKQRTLLSCVSMYIHLLRIPLNDSNMSGLYDALVQIRIHLCTRLGFDGAKQYYLYILDFIFFLQKVDYISGSFLPPTKIANTLEYKELKSTRLPIDVLEKIVTKDNSQKLTLLIRKHCSQELEVQINSYIKTLSKSALEKLRISATSFFSSIEPGYEWNKSGSYIENSLAKYNIDLNLRSPKDTPTSKSLYTGLKNFFFYLRNNRVIPQDVDLPPYQSRSKTLLTEEIAKKNSRRIEKSIDIVKSHLNPEPYQIVKREIDNLTSTRIKIDALNDLIKYIYLLKKPINILDKNRIHDEFNLISRHISKSFVFDGAKRRLNNLAVIIEKIFKEGITLPKITSENNYKELREIYISEFEMQKIAVKPSSEDAFNDALNKFCSTGVKERLLDYVNSYKAKERKAYRKPLTDFLNQISDSSKQWEKNAKLIQAELMNYRDNLLGEFDRSTAYQRYANTKNGLKVLIEHGLLPSSTYLPKNIKESSNVEKYSNNPLILKVDLRHEENQKNFSNSQGFIAFVQSSLSDNLNSLVAVSREIISKGYAKYLSKNDVVSRSKDIENITNLKNFDVHKIENKVAYFDCYFDKLIRNERLHNMKKLKFGNDIFEYFGLTPLICSAMQIVITEERGFNAHSLYESVVSSPNRGEGFILVNDEGSVRVKVHK